MIIKANLQHAQVLSQVGTITFINAHMQTAPAHEITSYVDKKYNKAAIRKELLNQRNIYHLVMHENTVAGFSKMELNSEHPSIPLPNVSKIDQLYLLDYFHGLKLGALLLQHNIEFSKSYKQSGMWLVVWTGNKKAISFYEKFGFHIVEKSDFKLTDTHVNPCYIMLLQYSHH